MGTVYKDVWQMVINGLHAATPSLEPAAAGCHESFVSSLVQKVTYIRQMDLLDTQIYGLIGDDAFERLVAAFYKRVPADDILGQMYHGRDMAGAQWRLREFLGGRFGGPGRYVEQRGHPPLRMRHHPFKIDQQARDRWILLMSAALQEAQLPKNVEETLLRFFQESATFMINQS
jgi:hemoglobin